MQYSTGSGQNRDSRDWESGDEGSRLNKENRLARSAAGVPGQERHSPAIVDVREVEDSGYAATRFRCCLTEEVAQVCKKLGVTEVTYYRWRRQYDGATRDTVKKLKELEKENGELKHLLADQMLENRVLRDISEGNF